MKKIFVAFLLCFVCCSGAWAEKYIFDVIAGKKYDHNYTCDNKLHGRVAKKDVCWESSNGNNVWFADVMDERVAPNTVFIGCDARYNGKDFSGCKYFKVVKVGPNNYEWELGVDSAIHDSADVPLCNFGDKLQFGKGANGIKRIVNKTQYAKESENAVRVLIGLTQYDNIEFEVLDPYHVGSTAVEGKLPSGLSVKVGVPYCYAYKCNENFKIQDGKCVDGRTPDQICAALSGEQKKECNACFKYKAKAGGVEWENGSCECTESYYKVFENGKCVWLECTDEIENAKKAEYNDDGNCIVKSCNSNYDKYDNECLEKCTVENTDLNAITVERDLESRTCVATKCKKTHKLTDKKKCESIVGKPCNENIPYSTERRYNDQGICVASACQPNYHVGGGGCILDNGQECKSKDKKAKKAFMTDDKCFITECFANYYVYKNECVPNDETECTPTNVEHVKKAVYRDRVCTIVSCDDNYQSSDDGQSCVQEDGIQCSLPDVANVKRAEYKDAECVVVECVDGYKVSADKKSCEYANGDTCVSQDPNAEHAEFQNAICVIKTCKTGYQLSVDGKSCVPADGTPCELKIEYISSAEYEKGVCIVKECVDGFMVSDDKKSCIYDEKLASQRKIDELQENADAMHDKEHSTANKLLGGAAIGATGIGAMQALSAYSEQQSDEDAETAMKAYLATFHCNYGGGINVKGGEKDVQLPGGNELIGLYAEYVNLANNLKVRKAALDMRPGIESEAILDSATSGLYDDVSIGKTSGAFTSLARALQNPDGPDAQAWAAQKDDSAKKLKTGLTVAGIGAVGGAVGNLLINKNAPKESSEEINRKYNQLKSKFGQIQATIDALPGRNCSEYDGTNGGVYPDCKCSNAAAKFSAENGCETCPAGQKRNDSDVCVPDGCTLNGEAVKNETCECMKNAQQIGNECKCETGYTKSDNECVRIETPSVEKDKVVTLQIASDVTFASGSATVKDTAKRAIAAAITEALTDDDIKAINNYKIKIIGHTDRVPVKADPENGNMDLSKDRANAIKKLFMKAGVDEDRIETEGKAAEECLDTKYPKDNDERCRRVDVKIILNPSGFDISSITDNINVGDIAGKLLGGAANGATQ